MHTHTTHTHTSTHTLTPTSVLSLTSFTQLSGLTSTVHAAYWVLGVSRSTGMGDPACVAETWYCARSRNKLFLMNNHQST